jgi:hypothetical protein
MKTLPDKLKQFTIEDIRSWQPCYDPAKYLTEDWSGNILDILDNKNISFEDRLWVILRTELVSEKLMRLFAVWCARQVQHLITDIRSLKALDVAEAFANGEATKKQLDAALDAAWAAARGAAWTAVEAAARAAALDAALDAAWAAARGAVEAAALDAALDAARAAALDAARAAQESKLREMILAGIETGDCK